MEHIFANDLENSSEVFLTKNNTFIWPARDVNFNLIHRMSRDFGKTTKLVPVPNHHNFVFLMNMKIFIQYLMKI